MARREIGSWSHHVESTGAGGVLRQVRFAVVLAVLMVPQTLLATTVTVSGGPGLDQGAICAIGTLCPSTPIFSLVGAAPVSGSFTYNSGPQTVDFTLTLLANASFGGPILLAGSTFSATGVPVFSTPFGGGVLVSQSGAANGFAGPVFLSPALPLSANTPVVSALTCLIGSGIGDQCGVSLGSGGLEINNQFSAFLTFNTAVVPLPAAAWLFGSALGLVGVMRRRTAV